MEFHCCISSSVKGPWMFCFGSTYCHPVLGQGSLAPWLWMPWEDWGCLFVGCAGVGLATGACVGTALLWGDCCTGAGLFAGGYPLAPTSRTGAGCCCCCCCCCTGWRATSRTAACGFGASGCSCCLRSAARGAGTASGGGGGRCAGGSLTGGCTGCSGSGSTAESLRSRWSSSPHGGSGREFPVGCSSSRVRCCRALRARRSSASGVATSPRIMAATVLAPSPRAFGGRYACFLGAPPSVVPLLASSLDALSISSKETSRNRRLSGGSGLHCVSYNSSKSVPPTFVPVRARQMLALLSTRMRGARTEVRKWRPSGAHSAETVQFA
mmetsp:Transcript_115390/g.372849  ORF Transcript_115390/g.372849 Transcript_115390/m.372849 type:complete len:325 (-) Transcript_115390:1357-2331(-)